MTQDERARLIVATDCDPIAYSTLQPGLEYFDTPNGYVAYRKALGLRLTLGPPVCAASDRKRLADAFLAEKGHAVFFYVTEDFARLLPDRFSAGIGIDKVVPLSGELTSAKEVRGALKKARAAGFRVAPVRAEDHAAVATINAQYLGTRALPYEMKFLNRPMDLADDGLARQYVLRWKENGVDAVRGYARLNPNFRSGVARGYLLDILRFGPTKLWGVFFAAPVVANTGERLAQVGDEMVTMWDGQQIQIGEQQMPATVRGRAYPLEVCVRPGRDGLIADANVTVVLTGTTSVRRYTVSGAGAADLVVVSCDGSQPLLKAVLSEAQTNSALPAGIIQSVRVESADIDPLNIPTNRMRVILDVGTTDTGTLILSDGSRWSPSDQRPIATGVQLVYLVPALESSQDAVWEP